MKHLPKIPDREGVCAYELNGRIGVSPTPLLTVDVTPPPDRGYADAVVSVQLRVVLLPTKMWFLNRLRIDGTSREARILKYDALRDTWNAVTKHKW